MLNFSNLLSWKCLEMKHCPHCKGVKMLTVHVLEAVQGMFSEQRASSQGPAVCLPIIQCHDVTMSIFLRPGQAPCFLISLECMKGLPEKMSSVRKRDFALTKVGNPWFLIRSAIHPPCFARKKILPSGKMDHLHPLYINRDI